MRNGGLPTTTRASMEADLQLQSGLERTAVPADGFMVTIGETLSQNLEPNAPGFLILSSSVRQYMLVF